MCLKTTAPSRIPLSIRKSPGKRDQKGLDKDFSLITIPWFDIGLLPFDGRIMGFGAFEMTDAKATGAYPKRPWPFCRVLGKCGPG